MTTKSWLSLLTVLVIFVILDYRVVPMLTKADEVSPSVVRVGVLPDMSEEDLLQRYNPLLAYLSERTGHEVRLVLPADYAELLDFFGAGELDLALFGGLTYVQANALYQAEPLVMRDVDTRFISVFVVRQDDPAIELADLKGRVIAFGSDLSTSGHLMPRYFLRKDRQIIAEQFFSQIVYSGAHDKTVYMVRKGKADIGAANAEIVNSMLSDGRLQKKELRVVWETPPYPDYVWAVPRHMDEDVITQLRDAFLRLDLGDEHHRHILAALGARNFLPAGNRMYQPLQRIAADLELLGAE